MDSNHILKNDSSANEVEVIKIEGWYLQFNYANIFCIHLRLRMFLRRLSILLLSSGNMTWWTTDVDLQTMILSCGATNLIDIKFYENRNNGQSKGFALAVFTAESSVKTVMEKLPQKTLHGQQLVVLPYTKASLAKFEDATRRVDQVFFNIFSSR